MRLRYEIARLPPVESRCRFNNLWFPYCVTSPFLFHQDIWVPQTLYRREKHEPAAEAEGAGEGLERASHPSPVCSPEGLFCLRGASSFDHLQLQPLSVLPCVPRTGAAEIKQSLAMFCIIQFICSIRSQWSTNELCSLSTLSSRTGFCGSLTHGRKAYTLESVCTANKSLWLPSLQKMLLQLLHQLCSFSYQIFPPTEDAANPPCFQRLKESSGQQGHSGITGHFLFPFYTCLWYVCAGRRFIMVSHVS